jgi:hypothetical protein|tara:strand:+ start:313 stop:726 length:414 start_codon:yes stop_codon:yes gene_type:complete
MEEKYIELGIDDLIEVVFEEDDDFLKIKETLTRIGVSSRKENKLWQSCHILHKRGKYYIVHFKELFALDGLPTNLDIEDIGRRNTITNLLEEWGLLEVVEPERTEEPTVSIGKIKILPFKEKENWELCPKYHIGKKK